MLGVLFVAVMESMNQHLCQSFARLLSPWAIHPGGPSWYLSILFQFFPVLFRASLVPLRNKMVSADLIQTGNTCSSADQRGETSCYVPFLFSVLF